MLQLVSDSICEETELDGVIIVGRGSNLLRFTLHTTNNVIRKHSLSTLPVMKTPLFSPGNDETVFSPTRPC